MFPKGTVHYQALQHAVSCVVGDFVFVCSQRSTCHFILVTFVEQNGNAMVPFSHYHWNVNHFAHCDIKTPSEVHRGQVDQLLFSTVKYVMMPPAVECAECEQYHILLKTLADFCC